MSTDRELLELAAKAAGPEIEWDGDEWVRAKRFRGYLTNYEPWDPLVDDGDAFRLAVNLGMTVNPYQEGVFVSRFEGEQVVGEPFEVIGRPDTAATRRAIVRAAAEIGRAA